MIGTVQHTRMTRGSRVARGAAFAVFATLFAAISHVMVGGNVPAPVSLVATGVAVLPLCVALAGRELSLWRSSLAVTLSQGLFHWSFGSIGASPLAESASISSVPVSAHAGHLGLATTFIPSVEPSSVALGWLMLCAHAVAAGATIAMLRFGEIALRRIRESLAAIGARCSAAAPAPMCTLPAAGGVNSFGYTPLRPLASARSSISHRGPPVLDGCTV